MIASYKSTRSGRPTAAPRGRLPGVRGRRGAIALVVLAAVTAGLAVFYLLRSRSSHPLVEFDESEPSPVHGTGGDASGRQLELPVAPREGVGDGADVPHVLADDFDERRIVVAGVGIDGSARGTGLRDSLLAHPGVFLRFRSESAKTAFLEADFRIPEPAYLPRATPPGIEVHALVDLVRLAGFEAIYAKPMVLIGPRQDGSAAGPR